MPDIGLSLLASTSAWLLASAPLEPLGSAGAACRPNEPGPALEVSVDGLKDRRGNLRIELYPANEEDFLADDSALLGAGKTFRRIDIETPPTGPVTLCIRAPRPGPYAVLVLHDRNADGKFGLRVDGVGFPSNPSLGFSKPKAEQVTIVVGPGITHSEVLLNYLSGLSFRPIGRK